MKHTVSQFKENKWGGAATVASPPLACQNIKDCARFFFSLENLDIFLLFFCWSGHLWCSHRTVFVFILIVWSGRVIFFSLVQTFTSIISTEMIPYTYTPNQSVLINALFLFLPNVFWLLLIFWWVLLFWFLVTHSIIDSWKNYICTKRAQIQIFWIQC